MKINDKDYKVVTGYGTVVKFCAKNNLEFYEFLNRFAAIDPEKLRNDFFMDLAGYTVTMIERGGDEPPDFYEIIDWLGKGNAGQVMELLFEGLSVPKNAVATGKKS
jgi:hypothetical protein